MSYLIELPQFDLKNQIINKLIGITESDISRYHDPTKLTFLELISYMVFILKSFIIHGNIPFSSHQERHVDFVNCKLSSLVNCKKDIV